MLGTQAHTDRGGMGGSRVVMPGAAHTCCNASEGDTPRDPDTDLGVLKDAATGHMFAGSSTIV